MCKSFLDKPTMVMAILPPVTEIQYYMCVYVNLLSILPLNQAQLRHIKYYDEKKSPEFKGKSTADIDLRCMHL